MNEAIRCPSCGSESLEYIGLQWFPEAVFQANGWYPSVRAVDRPNEGALRNYTCSNCQTTFTENPRNMSASVGD